MQSGWLLTSGFVVQVHGETPIEKGKVTAKLSLSENGWEGRRGVTPVLNTGSRKGQVRLLPHPLTVRLSYARAFTEGR